MLDVRFDYGGLLESLKKRITLARLNATLRVNQELIELYWHIGSSILRDQRSQGWGSKVIDQLSHDLRIEFPSMRGLSRRNLHYMRQFAEAYPDLSIVQLLVAQLPWGHIVTLLDRVRMPEVRNFYAREAIEHGWSRAVLDHHISTKLFERSGKAQHNFERTLPPEQSDLARQLFKDPYSLEFLDLTSEMNERAMERALVVRIKDFLLELGSGFAFIGNQYHLAVSDKDYYLDLLFYHVRLHAYVVIELKVEEFKPEFAGKMNFYLAALDDLVRQPMDNPSIGLILCKTRDKVIVEYALRDSHKPIGVAEYRLPEELDRELRAMLPSPEELALAFEEAVLATTRGE